LSQKPEGSKVIGITKILNYVTTVGYTTITEARGCLHAIVSWLGDV